jgi:long-chain acyl-CoA synthetase
MAFGSVGPIIQNVECKIAEDGEICVKGPNVMQGYYNAPEKTKEVIDEDGWFHTGDIGIIDENGCLKITDRKKEIFKTSGGKYIAPQQSENLLKESNFIEQVMVLGEGEKFPAAFITPAWDVLEEWAHGKGFDYSDRDELVTKDEVMDHYRVICERYNRRLGKWEQIKKFEILNAEWSVEGKELTPTMKLKRRVILEKHQDSYSKLYNKED